MFLAATQMSTPYATNANGYVTAVSDDGRYALFTVYNNPDPLEKVHLMDFSTGEVKLIPVPSNLGAGFWSLGISGDGTKMAFVAGDRAAFKGQIYVTDLQTGSLQLVSSNSNGEVANSEADWTADHFFGNGRYLAFDSTADNLVAGDTNGKSDVFVKDLQTGITTLASSGSNSEPGNNGSYGAQVSADGRYVFFESYATNFGIQDGYTRNLFVKDLQTGQLQYANRSLSGEVINPSPTSPYTFISADGSKIAYSSYSLHAMVKDIHTGELSYIARDASGQNLMGSSYVMGISTDGRYVTFSAGGDNFLPGDGDSERDIYQKDLQTGALHLLTPHATGNDNDSTVHAVSGNAQHIFYQEFKPSTYNPLTVLHTNGLSNNAGNDVLIGTNAADQLVGGAGNDHYWLDHAGDVVTEAANAGSDTVSSLIADYSLPPNLENLLLAWQASLNLPALSAQDGAGNDLNNRITGNDLNNRLAGMAGNDVLIGSKGNDILDGGAGADIVLYGDSSSGNAINKVADSIEVKKLGGQVDLLKNIERIQFSDTGYSYQGDINSAQAYRIYQAALNRTPDSAGLGYWIKQIDKGAQLSDIAQGFMQSQEFKNMYGANPANSEMVQKFYQNVLHRAPDAGGLQYWTSILDNQHANGAQVLASFSESAENQAALIGVIDAGFSFTVFAG